MQAYQFALQNVKLYGPTYFGPTIEVVSKFVAEHMHEKLYHILLILTDGDIHDMQATKDLIVAASRMPLSIIIVGIGNDKFNAMIELDGDEVILKDQFGVHTKRDIVQFVRYNDFKHAGEHVLSQEVLQEVPEQIISYICQNKIVL